MLGWDVGYVWPLLEGVVVAQVTHSLDPWHIVMGNPREASQSQQDGGAESTSTTTPWSGSRLAPNPLRPASTDPPPYDSIAGSTQNYRSHSTNPDTPSHQAPRSTTVEAGGSDGSCHGSTDAPTLEGRSRMTDEDLRRMRTPRWPHKASSAFACLCCVLGMYNISRFSVLVYIYKGCFIFQFLLLSLVIGIPVLYLQMALGQYLGAGLLDMWYISPAFKGLGLAMLYIYIILGVYSAVPLSWLFVYFKDSFITLKDSYKWGRCQYNFARNGCLKALNSSSADYYGWSVPSYFHGRVLGRRAGEFQFGELKFEIAFNLCLVWLIVFVCLSRGPKTLGKVVYMVSTLPIILLIMVTMRMGQQWGEGIMDLFSSPWKPVLVDSTAWMAAAREVFLTWGLLGSVALHLCSHNKMSTNITKTLAAVAIAAILILIMSSFLFSCTAKVFLNRNLSFIASSYEEETSVRVLSSGLFPTSNITVTNIALGESLVPMGKIKYLSGYQVLRLATEVFPAALAVEGVRNISSFWAICFYITMILFGLGQQIVLWYCVVESVIAINFKVFKAWHTTTTFIMCNLAFLLGLPITSNIGIYIIYYLDFCIGSLWWIVVLYLIMFFAVLFIRGRPYGTDQLVNMIVQKPSTRTWVLPLLTFQWNVVLPVSFMVLTIAFLRSSSLEPSSSWSELEDHYAYWPQWAKTLTLCLQICPLLMVVSVCAYQAFRIFVSKSDLPFSERAKFWCCPVLPLPTIVSRHSPRATPSAGQGSINSGFVEDPPPKYTPPPSYSTATSRMLAKRLDRPSTTSFVDLESLEDDMSTIDEEGLSLNSSPSRRESVISQFSDLQRTSNVPLQS